MKRRIAWALVGAVTMSLFLVCVVTMVRTNSVVDLIREDQKASVQRNKTTASNTEQIKRVAEQIESCTSPDGECFKRGQERTGKAVASINDVILAAAACDQGSTPLPQIRACVAELLKANQRP